MPPGKHDQKEHGPRHGHKGPKPKPHGPKERELAVSLTVAILGAAKIDGPLDHIEREAAAIFGRMYALVSDPRVAGSPTHDDADDEDGAPRPQLQLGTGAKY